MLSDREILSATWLLLVGVVFLLCIQRTNAHCSRPLSRIVRSQLNENFYSVFEAKNVVPHSGCPLLNSTDLYSIQEENKFQEHGAKWVCNFCGKAFYSEYYLDRHFENRHVDMLVKGTTVCLADFCDIFRCDFFEDQRKDRFWEKKLCKEERLTVRRKRCEALVRSCLPRSNLTVDEEFEIYETIRKNTCLLLNCKDYWKPLYEEFSPWKVVLYAMVTPFFFMGLIVYYYALWEHYYGDYPFESHKTIEADKSFSRQRKHERIITDSMRKRYRRRDIVM